MIVLSESKTGDFGRELWKLGEEEANELSKVPGAGKMARFASDQNGVCEVDGESEKGVWMFVGHHRDTILRDQRAQWPGTAA
jgi:hypothetical protein